MSRKRINAEPLYNHSRRAFISHQIATSTGPTLTGRAHSHLTTSWIDAPEEDVVDEDVDMDLPDLMPMEDSDDEDEDGGTRPGIKVIATKVPAKRYTNSDDPLETWRPYRDEYLAEEMRSEGRANMSTSCAGCLESDASYRCTDCLAGALWCITCLKLRHVLNPLHNTEAWNGTFFEPQSLQSLGLRVQLGHPPSRRCPRAEPAHVHFTVIHSNGIHQVAVDYCRCNDLSHRQQLMRVGWWPATPLDPRTCATLEVLRHFHLLNLQGKVPAFSFLKAIELQTDNTGLSPTPDRLAVFMRMVRQYRHIKMAKRGGRGFAPDGIAGTQPGSLAIPCRACPIPEVNLPQGWENVGPARSWLYTLTLGMDANFRLKSRLRGPVNRDLPLGPGFSYFVEYGAYTEFIREYVDQDDIKTCVGFQALENMLTKNSKGLRATGMGAVSCARHELFRPLGLGDLQKGERQCNMDYLFASSVVGTQVKSLRISYDVVCQWFVKFWTRNRSLPPSIRLQLPESAVDAKVPKFHLQSHTESCHAPYAFNYTVGGARTDGEGVERNWKGLNGQASSTAEMGAGGRYDTLDDCCGHMNWRKTVGMGKLFLKRMLEAMRGALRSRRDFDAFNNFLRSENAAQVDEWQKALDDWLEDHSCPDPFRALTTDPDGSLAQVKLALASEYKATLDEGRSRSFEVSPTSFLLLGMSIQGTLELLKREIKGVAKPTALQATSFVESRTTLLKRLNRFREIQHTYMPGVDAQVLAHEARLSSKSPATAVHVEDATLFMPSELTNRQRDEYCVEGLAEIENRLRYAEAFESLEELRRHLRCRTYMNRFKVKNITGQKDNTRARDKQSTIDAAVKAAELRYNRARTSLLTLRGPGDWEASLQVLHSVDVRGLNERSLTEQEKLEERQLRLKAGIPEDDIDDVRIIAKAVEVGEGARRPSWLWFSSSTGDDMSDPIMRACLQIEWTKAKCRADRWEEEVVLLDEEMRRVLEYCSWKADWWTVMAGRAQGVESALAEGMTAYAAQQADQERRMAENFAAKWVVVRDNARYLIDRVQGTSSAPPLVHSTLPPIMIDVEIDADEPDYEAMDSDFEE